MAAREDCAARVSDPFPDEAGPHWQDGFAITLLAAPGRGWLWIDLEETGRGPAAWDLATMVSHYTEEAGRTALSAYSAESGTSVPALAPFRRVRDLEAAVWLACMAHLYPARYREVAQRLLATVL